MRNKRILLGIPILIAIGFIITCWIKIIGGEAILQWQHFVALVFITIITYLYFTNIKKTLILTGVFFLAGTFGLLSLTAGISSFNFKIGPIQLPPLNGLSLGLLLLYLILNLDTIIEMKLNYEDKKKTT
jgi:hypothetical protein